MGDDAASNGPSGAEGRGDSERVEQLDRGDSERVEQFFEHWGRRLGRAVAGAAARAREEAEDIFAEAQSLRRGERE